MKRLPLLSVLILFASVVLAQNAWINEIHYDNPGTDTDEIIEVVVEDLPSWSLADFSIALYNGNDGETYSTITLDNYTAGETIEGYSIFYYNYTANGFSIQNGAPDGLALSYQDALIPGQFLSYEGSFTATNGPAAGETSTDIGVEEPGETGESLQLSGNGTQYDHFSWLAPASATAGFANNAQTFGTIAPDPEPDNHVTGFVPSDSTWYSIGLQWNDAIGANLPSGYLVKLSTLSASDITAPTDGVAETDNDSVRNIALGTESTIFYNLIPAQNYYFKIWPYSNIGADIDYKTDGDVPFAISTTDPLPPFINHETFESGDFGTWYSFSVASDKNWMTTNAVPAAIGTDWSAQMNGYQENEPSNDWLISPLLELSNFDNEKMCFYSQWKYGNSMEELKLKYSDNYTGGDPTLATWTEIPFTKPSIDESWIFSDTINLAAITNSDVHLAFHYLSSDSPRRWNIDEIQITGEEPSYIPLLVINEVMYNPPESIGADDYFEFIELYNNDPEPVNIDGFSITGDVQYTFSGDITLQPGEYLVLASHPDSVMSHYGITGVYGPFTGLLSNGEGEITFSNASGHEVDAVNYEVTVPWPEEPNGTGPSMELLAPSLDNSLPESWLASYVTGGTPGDINSVITEVSGIVISEIFYNPPGTNHEGIEYIEVYNSNAEDVNLGGCQFTNGIDFVFPAVTLGSGDYLVITRDLTQFLGTFGLPAYEWQGGDLNNTSDTLEMQDILGNVIDYVAYDSVLPWDTLAAGHGPSLELTAPNVDNQLPEFWLASTTFNTVLNSVDTVWCSPYDGFADDPPVAEFTADVTTIYASQYVTFTNTSTGDPDFLAWSFPGGTPDTSNLEVPHISYHIPGTYDVSLYVSNIYGEDTEVKSSFITVLPLPDPPIADFESDVQNIYIGETINYTDLSQNNPDTWEWHFSKGDPIYSNEQNPTAITYLLPGHLDVSLRVSNIAGEDFILKEEYITVLDTTPHNIIITEIMYNPPETDTDSLEFIELYNAENTSLFLEGYYFSGIDFTFPYYIFEPGEYLIIAANPDAILNTFGAEALAFDGGFLDNNGETISLFTPNGTLVDQVSYDDNEPWPVAADGNGPSLVLCDLQLDNSLPESWSASVDMAAINANNDTIWASPGAPCGNVPVPLAAFSAEPLEGAPGLIVSFSDQSLNDPVSWLWDFPGGIPESSTEQNPIVQYPQAGDFDVTLTVQNHWGSDTHTETQYIHISVGMGSFQQSIIKVLPNPSHDGLFNLSVPFEDNWDYGVFDMNGKLILHNSFHQKQHNINLMHLMDGVYLLRLSNNKNIIKNIKLIKN